MSPVMLGGIATAAGGALLAAIGVAAGRSMARRDRAAEVAWWEDTYADLAATYAADMDDARSQIEEALRIIEDLTDARLADADQGLQVWELPADVADQVRANWRRN